MTELAAAVEAMRASLAPVQRAAANLAADLTAEAGTVAHRSCLRMRVVYPRLKKRDRRAELATVLEHNRGPGLATVRRYDECSRSPLRPTLDADRSPPPGQLARITPAAAQAPPRPNSTRRHRGSVRSFDPPTTARWNQAEK